MFRKPISTTRSYKNRPFRQAQRNGCESRELIGRPDRQAAENSSPAMPWRKRRHGKISLSPASRCGIVCQGHERVQICVSGLRPAYYGRLKRRRLATGMPHLFPEDSGPPGPGGGGSQIYFVGDDGREAPAAAGRRALAVGAPRAKERFSGRADRDVRGVVRRRGDVVPAAGKIFQTRRSRKSCGPKSRSHRPGFVEYPGGIHQRGREEGKETPFSK